MAGEAPLPGGGNRERTPSVNLGPNQGQALLGPIVNSSVSLYEAEDFSGNPICTVTTSAEDDPDGPGIIDLSSCPVEADAVYFLVARGGMDIDVDDDGFLDSAPTPKNGALRALITGEDILNGEFRLNILTEIAYQSVTDSLLTGGTRAEILDRLNTVAGQLLDSDINGDEFINNSDILSFSPLINSGAIAGGNPELLERILEAILSGDKSELTSLSRQYLLSSLGEFDYTDLLGSDENFLLGEIIVENGILYAVSREANDSSTNLRILIVNVRDFSNITLIGQVRLNNLPESHGAPRMIKMGNFLYIVENSVGMIVVDVRDRSSPIAKLHIADGDFETIAAGSNNTFYVSGLDFSIEPEVKSISVYDISNPLSPSIRSTIHGHTATSMVYNNGYLYTNEISVFDGSVPGNLTFLGSAEMPGIDIGDVVYKDGFLYAATGDSLTGVKSISVLDVTNPNDIRTTDSISGFGFVTDLVIDGDLLFAGDELEHGSAVLTTFDIESDGTLGLRDSRSAPQSFSMESDSDRIYMSGSSGVIAYRVSALKNSPNHLDFIATSKVASHVEVIGNVAFVADSHDLLAIDISSPGEGLEILDRLSLIDYILDMRIVGDFAYLASATEGLQIIDISDSSNLSLVGANPDHVPALCNGGTTTCAREVDAIAVQGNYAYTNAGSFPEGILGKYLITEPNAPTISAETTDVETYFLDLAVKGNSLYAVNGNFLYVYNIDTMSLQSRQDLLANTIETRGNYAYTSSSTSGLAILNISNSANPVFFGGKLGLGIGNAVSVSGNTAYVANEFGLIELYDVSNRTNPELLFVYKINGTVRDVFATEDYIYAVNGFGLVVERAINLQSAVH